MDIMMPMMDGIEASRLLVADTSKKQVIIAITGNTFDEDKNACFDAGMSDFISKPIRMTQLNTMLRKYLV
jgi:CheY-like chemotaxis protein